MSKTMEAYLLDVIVAAAEQNVKQLAQALEEVHDFEQVVATVLTVSRACFAPVLRAMLESCREEEEQSRACPHCGCVMRNKGEQERGVVTPVGRVEWKRRYYYCKRCKEGHYPLDEHWGIQSEQFTDAYQSLMSLLGALGSYEQASAHFERVTGVSVSDRELGRTTIERGTMLERARLREQAKWLDQGPPQEQEATGTDWECSLDAAKVHFRDGWHDVKAGVVCPIKGKQRTSYLVEVESMERAGERLYAEVVRRGGNPDRDRMVCVADGAPTNWAQFEAHFTKRVEILDWYHATEHLWAAAKGVHGEGTDEARLWEERAEQALWAGKPEKVLEMLAEAAQQPRGQAALAQRHYFETNQQRMQYPIYREQGYPIGSGRMESGCKQAIIARARQSGMSWTKRGLQPVLALRAELLSGRFDEAWSLTQQRAA